MTTGQIQAKDHLSLASVQKEAEAWVLSELRKRPGYGTLKERRVDIGLGHCQPDGVTDNGMTMVEIYARVGRLTGSQPKKIATDILKFATLKRQKGRSNVRCEIYFVDADAKDSVTGWKKEAANQFGVKLNVIEIPGNLRKKLLKAQLDQAEGMRGQSTGSNG